MAQITAFEELDISSVGTPENPKITLNNVQIGKSTTNIEMSGNIMGRWTLAYDAKTADFSVGKTLTGASSGFTAKIFRVDDNGDGTGILHLIDCDLGNLPEDNEVLADDGDTPAAAVANGTLTSIAKIVGIASEGYVERVYIPAGGFSPVNFIASGVVRGLSPFGLDLTEGSAEYAKEHNGSAKVIDVFSAQEYAMFQAAILGQIANGAKKMVIGTEEAENEGVEFAQGLANRVRIYPASDGLSVLVRLANGSSFVVGAGVGSIIGGDGIDITSGEVSVELDTVPALEFSGGKMRVKVEEEGGISRGSGGLSVNEGDLSLANLGEKNFSSLNRKRTGTFGEAVDGTTTPVLVAVNATTTGNKRYENSLNNTSDIVAGVNWFGDVFTTDACTTHLTKISLWIQRVSNPPGDLVLSLFATSGGLPTESALATVTVNANTGTPTTAGYFDFTFSSPVAIAKNTTYAWTISNVAGTGASNYILLFRQNSGYYPNGTQILSTNSGVSWSKDVTGKHTYAVWGYNISDGKIYKLTTNESSRSFPLGFCRENVALDAVGSVEYFDVVAGFTGLIPGTKYYAQATAGTIGTSGSILVGTAISATEILMGR